MLIKIVKRCIRIDSLMRNDPTFDEGWKKISV
jgi:hypothetical protein